MRYILLAIGLFLANISHSQDKAPIEVTPEMQRKIMKQINLEVPKLKQRLEKEKENEVAIEFTIDTFRIERLFDKWIKLDYGDFGMRDAAYGVAVLYDSLMNKYYRKLSSVLEGDDKKFLMQAQKAWLSYRDNETELVGIISKDEYSGGGTMQQLTEASEYLDLIKKRTNAIFNHYIRATQNY